MIDPDQRVAENAEWRPIQDVQPGWWWLTFVGDEKEAWCQVVSLVLRWPGQPRTLLTLKGQRDDGTTAETSAEWGHKVLVIEP